jgi:AcrR family transcriptional regulator
VFSIQGRSGEGRDPMISGELHRVDPRVRRTRKLLQAALLELLQEKSFASISIQEIAERATVNRATFYTHFADKYALADSIIREQFMQAIVARLPSAPGWSRSSLRILIRAVFDFLSEFQSHCKPTDRQFDPLMERAVQQELTHLLLDWLRRASDGMDLRERVRPETLAAVMSWAMFGTAAEWSQQERRPSAEEMTEQVAQILIEGVAHLAVPLLPE